MDQRQKTLAVFALVALLVLAQEFSGTDAEKALQGTRTMSQINDFTAKIKPTAQAVQKETGISARLGTAQAALESGYGSSQLTVKANNIFGFKCGEAWLAAKRPFIMMPTTDYYAKGQKMPNGLESPSEGYALKWPAPFRAYASWDESYRDWARLMQTPGYVQDGALAALKADDLKAFGVALSKRYAPNQNYDTRLAQRASEMGMVT